MPLTSAFNGASNRVEGFFSSIKSRIYDSFARVTSGTLGTATTGQTWTLNNGVWTANNGIATTATIASSYPNATIPFKTNVTVSAQSVGQGAGVVFWQSGANDWWAAASSGSTSQYISSYTCNANSCCTGANNCTSNACCTGANNCTPSATCGATNNCVSKSCCTGSNTCQESSTCGSISSTCQADPNCGATTNYTFGCTEYITNTHGQAYCVSYGQVYASYYAGKPDPCCYGSPGYAGYFDPCCSGSNNCVSSDCCTGSNYAGTYNACCTGANNCASSACCTGSNNCASNSCCTQTANYSTQWNWVLNIIKSVSGTISNVANSTIATSFSNTNQIKGVKATTNGSNVSVQGYSDNALTTTLGSPVTATAPSSPTGTGVGIILTPGGTNQGNSVGPFTAQ